MDGNAMGWRLLCLLLYFGRCLSMQPGLEYHYRYTGHLATGITEMRSQYAATGIRMDITVQVEADYSFLIQFYDIQIGEFHDTLDCHYFKSELPLTYSDLEVGEEYLLVPFKIAMNAAQSTGTLEVPKDEPLWITNVKKAVIDVFPLAALWKEIQLGRGERFLRPNFGAEDELIGGQCMTWYSATKLPEDEAAQINKKRQSRIEEDIQLSGSAAERLTSAKGPGAGAKGPGAGAKGPAAGAKGPAAVAKGPAAGGKGQKTSQGIGGVPLAEYSTPIPPISESLWKVARTIDYDMCEEKLVRLKVNAPSSTQKLISRSSVARYLLRGDQLGIRVEKGVVEGAISLYTSSDADDRIDTFTNQTVDLKAVRRITRKISINYEVKRFRHWYFEFDQRSGERYLNVEETLTGIEIPASHFPELKESILFVLGRLEESPRYLADARRDLSEHVTYLSYSHIKEIYEELEAGMATGSEDDQVEATFKLYNFHLSLVISGTEPALNYLLDKVSEEGFMENTSDLLKEGIISLYEIGSKTIKDPSVIPRMVEFAMTMSWEKYGSTNKAMALTAVASLVQKLCFSADRRRTYTDGSCRPEHVCDSAAVANSFLPYLQQKIRESSNNVTLRVVYIQALVNLGMPKTLDVLAPVIMGTTDNNVGVRKIAIMALSSHIMHHSTLSMVFELLMPIIENRGEHPEIRNVAFLALASWNPGLTWWKHMAYFTWQEPSSQVSNFVSSAMHQFKENELYESVSRVVHLVKPPISSLTHSQMVYTFMPQYSEAIGIHTELLWFASAEGLLPTHLSLRTFSKSLYGFPLVTKLVMHQQGLSRLFVVLFEKMFRKPIAGEQDQSIVQDMIRESLEQLGLQQGSSTNWQLWQTEDDVFRTRGYAGDFATLAQELLGEDIMFAGHDIWVDSTVALPTDIGLPIIIKHTEDSAISEKVSETEVDAPSLANCILKKGFDNIIGFSYSTSIRVKTLVPWSRRTPGVGAGIQSFSDVSLPFAIQFGAVKDHKSPKEIVEAVVRIQSSVDEEVRLVHVRNRPYTVTYGTLPTQPLSSHKEYKTVNSLNAETFNTNGQFLSGSGIHLAYTWESADVSQPELGKLFFYQFTKVVPQHKTWEYQLVFDPNLSDTTAIEFIFKIVTIDWPSGSSASDDLTQFGQQSQGQEDFDDFSQFSQSASQDYSQFSQSASQDYADFSQQSQGADLVDLTDEQQRSSFGDLSILSKFVSMKSTSSAGEGFGPIYGIGLFTTMYRSESAKTYNSRLFMSTGVDLQESKNINLFMAAFDFEGQREPAIVTLWSLKEPLFVPFASMEEFLRADLKAEIGGKFKLTIPPLKTEAHVEATFEVSDNQIAEIKDRMAKKCSPDHVDDVMEVLISDIFDQVDLQANWDETFQMFLKSSGIYKLMTKNFHTDSTEGDIGHELQLKLKKDLAMGYWTLRGGDPSAHAVAERVQYEPELDLPFFSFNAFVYEIINGRRSSYCTIKDSGVRTFDALEYPATPSNCWKIAAHDCHGGRAMFKVRKTDQWEVRVLWKDEGLVFDISNSDILVNGEPTDERDERYRVLRFDDALLVTFSTNAAVKVSDKVEILSPPEIRSLPCGLCGNFDGEKTSEMIGPKGCVYTDAELFSHAWSLTGDGCNAFSLRGHKQRVERYQQNCPKRAFVPTGVSHSGVLSQCTSWQFINKMEGSWNCTAIIRTPKCKKGCVSQYSSPQPIPFDCFATDRQQPSDETPCYSRTISSFIPAGCRKP